MCVLIAAHQLAEKYLTEMKNADDCFFNHFIACCRFYPGKFDLNKHIEDIARVIRRGTPIKAAVELYDSKWNSFCDNIREAKSNDNVVVGNHGIFCLMYGFKHADFKRFAKDEIGYSFILGNEGNVNTKPK
jgi:hypothetical protein